MATKPKQDPIIDQGQLDDPAFQEWKRQRSLETSKSAQETGEKVPLKLSDKLQVWIPVELSVIVQSLWTKTGAEEALKISSSQDTERQHLVKVWSTFLKAISDTTADIKTTSTTSSSNSLSPASKLYLLRVGHDEFTKVLNGNNIHAATRGFPNQVEIIQTYLNVSSILLSHENHPSSDHSSVVSSNLASKHCQQSTLLKKVEERTVGLFAVFGGQGPQWYPELKQIYLTYPSVRSVIEQAAAIVLEQSQHPEAVNFYRPHGFHLISWLNDHSVPSPEFLSSAPVSCPMILFTQMLNYLITCSTWQKSPEQAARIFKGATGHSQGLIGATIMATATSETHLIELILTTVRFMTWFGLRLQQATPFPLEVRSEVRAEAKQLGYPTPTPMLAVLHLQPQRLHKYITMVNKTFPTSPERHIEIALKNAPTINIVVGHPESLHQLVTVLHRAEMAPKSKQDQNRIPHSKRKREFVARFLPVSVPFHWTGIASCVEHILQDAQRLSFSFDPSQLQIPVYGTDGTNQVASKTSPIDMRQSKNLLRDLVQLTAAYHVDWVHSMIPVTPSHGVTHLVDFGHGGLQGIGALCARNLTGAGIQVISAGSFTDSLNEEGKPTSPFIQGKAVLFDTTSSSVVFAPSWAKDYAPKLISRGGKLIVDTKYTRALGKPPVMVAGMTPTTVNHKLIAAVLNAGFHGELAGGGLPTAKMFQDKIDALVQESQIGSGVTLNLLFLNPTQWGMQYPLTAKLASEGYPIEGLTIGAGVPSLEKATEILTTLREAGLQYIAFKPGSVDAILAVVEIAKHNPETTVLLQWTGGRGGGHHSCEDFHEPILSTYGKIRQEPNIVLVGGSGFGDAKDSWPYMDGSWSVAYGHPPMPFDAILIASRVMVAKEAGTSDEAKKLIVDTPGIEKEEQWENSYDSTAGGVVTVQSELGEPIHKVATRGIMLWRQFDKEFFSLPKDKIGAKIEERKSYIIERLNADFQKVYFGKKFDGTVVDLKDMTYAEVAFRMVELQYVYHEGSNGLQGRWIHKDYLKLVYDFVSRIEERFSGKRFSSKTNSDDSNQVPQEIPSLLGPIESLETNPHSYLTQVVEQIYPDSSTQLLCSEDVDFFISICKQRGRKPVNFVPVINADLSFWFKKDSLWQSEDLEAVPEKDVQRIVILQGPVAVRYSNKVNEPVADILNGIHDGWVQILQEKQKQNEVPLVDNLSFIPHMSSVESNSLMKSISKVIPHIEIERLTSQIEGEKKESQSLKICIPKDAAALPAPQLWLKWLVSHSKSSWWLSVLKAPFLTQQKRRVKNIIASLFHPRNGQIIELIFSPDDSHEIIQANITEDQILPHFQSGHPLVTLRYCSKEQKIYLNLFHVRPLPGSESKMVPVEFIFSYIPSLGKACIHEVLDSRNLCVKNFYSQLWFDNIENAQELFKASPLDASFTNQFLLTRQSIESFCQSVGRTTSTSNDPSHRLIAPLDMAIVSGWESIVKSLFLEAIDDDILQLVHLSNSFKRLSQQDMMEGDVVSTTMSVTEVANTPTGQRVTVEGTLSVEKTDLIALKSQFFFRGNVPFKIAFRKYHEQRVVTLTKKEVLAIVQSKNWINWKDSASASLEVGDLLVFDFNTVETVNGKDYDIVTKGTIVKQAKHAKLSTVSDGPVVATFELNQKNVAGCVVFGFVQRYGKSLEHPSFFSNSGYQMIVPDKIRVPLENHTYALASGDLNPIHTNPYFAIISKLPTTITHGMWTSANARRVVETFAAKNHPERVLNFSTEFVGMVRPGDVLITRLKHVGMKDGRMLIEIRTECQQTGEIVLKGSADVSCPKTAYVFTGQGSAEVGMGMDLYMSSPIAKTIWDAADLYFLNKYGFSILNIVKNNPKEITIYFGGKNGEEMRRNYQQLTQQVQVRDEQTGSLVTRQLPLFPQITDSSASFTFKHPEGLLFATQFSQPALVLVELSAFSDIRDKGIIPSDCIFAGHSLGEYAALASVASVLSTESLVDIVFLRGMTMQNAVIRDEAGRSPYAMVAVNPGRVHPTHFRDTQLNQVIAAITAERNELLQVVNYNVDNYQYVVAGERGNLNALGYVLNAINKEMSSMNLSSSSKGDSSSKSDSSESLLSPTNPKMKALIQHAIKQALDSKDPITGVFPLERGMATIPLPGIDVPFHSRFLKDGVPPFRQILQQRMDASKLNKDVLINRYIPNVTAAPFSLSRSYVESVYQNTNSTILGEVLENFEQESSNPQQLAFKLLVELLAYQFASPVRWIETQHLFFATLNVERFIEIGPAPTLFAMAKRTVESGQFSPLISREILWYGRDKANIYFQIADVEQEEPEQPAEEKPKQESKPAAPVAPVVQAAPAVVVPAAVSAAPVQDSAVSPFEFVQALISIRLKKPVTSVSENDTIKAIVAGKSALQNELLGDLETEFGTKMPEGASEATLSVIAKQMGANYKQLGKIGTTITHKLVSNKMPGGFGMSQVKAYLNKVYGLGDGKIQSVLLHAATMEPASRLSSEAEGNAFLDNAVSTYSSRTGQRLAAASSAPTAQAVQVAQPAVSSGPVASIPDQPVSAISVLRILVSLKVKKSIDQVQATSTIKDLVGGKSALQNELVGDLQKEFGTEPGDGASEMDLQSLAQRMGASYSKLGPYMSAAVSKLASSKLPGGFTLSNWKSYLSSKFGFGEGLSESVLAHSLIMEPQARLSSEAEAHAWIDQVAKDYASKHGVALASGGAPSGASFSSGAAVDSAALKAFEAKYNLMVKEHMAVYHEYLGTDPLASEKLLQMQEELKRQAEENLSIWTNEHGGDTYFDGIKPVFDTKKERRYNSSWNWNRQDCLQLYYDYACGRATQWSVDIRERLYHIKNRATPSVVDMVEHYLKKSTEDGHGEIKAFIQILADTLRFVMDDLPKYREHLPPTQPDVTITSTGSIQYKEVPRFNVKDMSAYVSEMKRGPQRGVIQQTLLQINSSSTTTTSNNSTQSAQLVQDHKELLNAIQKLQETEEYLVNNKATDQVIAVVRSQIDTLTKLSNQMDSTIKAQMQISQQQQQSSSLPFLFLRRSSKSDPSHRSYCPELTNHYLDVLSKIASEGLALTGKTALVIGCGKGSIGLEIVKGLLRAGATVYATTSRFSAESSSFYHKLFDKNGSKNSELIVLPFNQGSVQDVHSLVDYIYEKEGSDLDYIIPFAALPENGRDIGDIDGRSELAHRIMLTNVLRLIGAIKEKKKSLAIVTRPAHVLLPMSPNHGIFGFDGLYAESKLGLEALLNKWHSEGWKAYLSLAGAIIGWTRGTGLMNQNNVVAAGIEELGARTFSAQEMSFNLIGLLHPDMVFEAQNEPVLADLNGCLHLVPELNVVVANLRSSLIERASIKRAVSVDLSLDKEIESGKPVLPIQEKKAKSVTPRANIKVDFPKLPKLSATGSKSSITTSNGSSASKESQNTNSTAFDSISSYEKVRGMLDLENIVVITGFGEIGPYGSSRTRWEMESYGEFSLEGCIELAWMMGMIKYQSGAQGNGAFGWFDTKTGAPIPDHEIKSKYESQILEHTGIRLIEPELFGGYDPHNKMFLHQVALNKEMAPIEVSKEEAAAFKQRHGDAVDVYQDEESGSWFLKMKRGSVLYIPKSLKFDRFVAGQIPSTWDPAVLGIPADIINQVDRVTLFSLVSTVEALVSSGITDPYEFYQYVHVSEVGNTFGGGFGGMESIRRTYRDRLLELPVQGDILQETFINTVGAWLNMLLLSSSGPIKTPVGACATAVESVEIGVDTIKSGKAKVCIVGGYDDFGEEGSYEFANMKATANSAEEIAMGRTPREMSRPATSTRAGFVESQGAGAQILMTADLAVKMGVPIYAIVEHVSTATDKVGRSVPAPGKGILTTAREHHPVHSKRHQPFVSPLLDVEYRRRHLQNELDLISAWKKNELSIIENEFGKSRDSKDSDSQSSSSDADSTSSSPNHYHYQDWVDHIESEARRRTKVAYSTWGNDFYRGNPSIAPLRGALSVYGLTIDDIAVASFHGTGTKGNDINESQVLQKQLEHLGRTKGNVVLSIFQKYLTGHPKGAAASWMLNGLIQSMLTGIVPGNRNADNIDPKLRDCSHIVFLNRSLHTYGYKAGLLKSFGFGQVGGEVLIIHPNYVLAQLDDSQLKNYIEKRTARQNSAYRHWQDSVTGKTLFVQVKDHPPYEPEDEQMVYLDPLLRAQYDPKSKSWAFPSSRRKKTSTSAASHSSSKNNNNNLSTPNSQRQAKSPIPQSSSSETRKKSGPTPPPTGPSSQIGLKRNISANSLTQMEVMMREMGEGLRTTIDRGIGVDAQLIDEIEVCVTNSDFVARNFTNAEIAYCRASPDPSSSFAGRWAAKEAVIKAISSCDADNSQARNLWQGAGAPLKDIEIIPSGSGAPKVQLSGHAADVASLLSISTIKVAISHSGDYAIAQAIAR